MSRTVPIEHYTVEDYRRWEGEWELIEGIAYAMSPSPGLMHQTVNGEIHAQLHHALEECPHCRALFEIDVEFTEDTVVRPDALVICYKPEGDRLTRAPDLIFEILSPRTARRDGVGKFQLYRDEGVGHYVIVYPESKRAKVWRLVEGEYRKVGDFHDENHRFELSRCAVDFDFARLWRRVGGETARPSGS